MFTGLISVATLVPGVGPILGGGLSALGALFRCTLCMIAISIGIAFLAGDLHGDRVANAQCKAADVAMQLAAAQRDVKAAKDAAEFADQQLKTLDAENVALTQKVTAYEKAPHVACPLGDDRANRLRGIIGQP
jgi:hypothetical protein